MIARIVSCAFLLLQLYFWEHDTRNGFGDGQVTVHYSFFYLSIHLKWERLFKTPWPLWAPPLRAWIKPFEKTIFYINGQPSNKLLQSSLPNHMVSHGELAPTSAPSPLWFPPSSSSLEADTQAGRWASSWPSTHGCWTHRCTHEAFQVQRGWPSRRARAAP